MTDNLRIVMTTCPDHETAQHIAKQLVERQLAACVNLIPGIESFYHWQGKIENSVEYLLLIKTRADCYNELERVIQTLHPYELPEVLAVPIEAGLPAYLEWIHNNTKQP